MASQISINYVYATLNILSEYLITNNVDDLSYENLKKIVDDKKILENKIKITSKSKMGGWHAFVGQNRKHDTMKNLGEKWKNMSPQEKEPYNNKALEMREEDKQKKIHNENKIIFKKTYKKNHNKPVEKPKSIFLTFKNYHINNGNNDLNDIKEKYSNLSSEEINRFTVMSHRNFQIKNNSNI